MAPARVVTPQGNVVWLDEEEVLNKLGKEAGKIFLEATIVGTQNGYEISGLEGSRNMAGNVRETEAVKRRSHMLPDGTIVTAVTKFEMEKERSLNRKERG